MILNLKYKQWLHLQSELKHLQTVRHYIPKVVNKHNWKTALKRLPTHNGAELDEFLDNYERGMDIGLPEIPKPVHSKANPPMNMKANCKMASTIIKWHKKGYLMGPFDPSDPIAKECRINPVFCVPKPEDEVRPVVNYSKAIDGTSLNELLDPDWCTVEYIQLKEIVYTIKQVGVGAMVWAKDLEDGYFNIKVHPDQIKCIAFIFAGLLFIPMVMVFGLSTAPLIFTMFMWYAVSAIRYMDCDIMWFRMPSNQFERHYFQTDADIQTCEGGTWTFIPLIMYYLDDIFGVQTPQLVFKQYNMAGQMLKFLGLSAKASKDRPPNTTQILLGLEYDTIKQEVRVPREKVIRYTDFACRLMRMKQVTKRELFSLTGKARYASVQCRALSSFARGVEVHGHQLKQWHYRINMSSRLKKDIRLIIEGLEYNQSKGKSFDFILKPRNCFDYQAYTDASGAIGIGGYVNTDNAPFFQVTWKEMKDMLETDIQWKEMVAICVLIECNLELFKGKCINIFCDNQAVVWMLIKWRAPLHRTDLQHVLRRIARLCIFNDIIPWWDHIEGSHNITADRLSRFQYNPFEFAQVRPAKKPSVGARDSLQKCVDICL